MANAQSFVSKTWIEDNGTEASGSESRIRDA